MPLKFECNTVKAWRIYNNFDKNRAFDDKIMKLGTSTWLVGTNTKNKNQCHAEKCGFIAAILFFLPKWPLFYNYLL